MDVLYGLTFTTATGELFFIGLFRTCKDAKEVELRYRQEVPGFQEHLCEAAITKIPVMGKIGNQGYVFRFTGWNIDKSQAKVDVMDSMCYTNGLQAWFHYKDAQTKHQRDQWKMNRLMIGYCQYQNGFTSS